MMKRLAATGIVTAALGGALLTAASPALANGDENEVNQEKVAELNVLCNVAVLSVQKEAECGGSKALLSDKDQANKLKVK